jgi:PIN domain nuclease of toxin-antitoxin system
VRPVLLDTECWLWWHLHPERLNPRAASLFEERRPPLLLSAASSWEMAIKTALGKLELPGPIDRVVPQQLAEDGIDAMSIEHAHALRVARLPAHHSDPFDRLLIAQAGLDRLAMLTADPQFLQYDVDVVWAARQPPPRPPRGRVRQRR